MLHICQWAFRESPITFTDTIPFYRQRVSLEFVVVGFIGEKSMRSVAALFVLLFVQGVGALKRPILKIDFSNYDKNSH